MSSGIRPATMSDLAPVAAVPAGTWCNTFRGVLFEDFLDGMSEARQAKRDGRLLADPRCVCSVAVDRDEGVVGVASGGPVRSPLSTMRHALHVRRNRQREGLGMALCGPRGGLRVRGLDVDPYRRFHERLGGEDVAREDIVLGADRVC